MLNTAIAWNQEELLTELKHHPERFSPNVMLRGLYQETILPNVAFIGGGAEVAYWLQLKTLFARYQVFYPVILLRQSVLWIKAPQSKKREQLELSVSDIFKKETHLEHDYVARHSTNEWQTQGEALAIEHIFLSLKDKANAVDPTLKSAAEAALTKMKHQLTSLEQKMLRAEKKKMQVQLKRITTLKNTLFPDSSLQERVENFSEYYLEYGKIFFDVIKDGIRPLTPEFLVIE